MPKLTDIIRRGQNRSDLIEKMIADFREAVADLQDYLYTEFYNDFVTKAVNDGVIANTANVRNLINNSGVWQRYYRQSGTVGSVIVERLSALTSSISDHFNSFLDGRKLSDFEAIGERLISELGYDGKAFTRGGFLYNLMNDTTVERRVKGAALQAIRSGKPLSEFQKDIKALIAGDRADGKLGIVEGHYYTNANTAFSEFDRAMSLEVANKNGLDFAIWSGPRMTTTRDFCADKKGKLLHRRQIVALSKKEWKGKIPGQSCLVSCGGYNCVDVLLWISTELAADGVQNKTLVLWNPEQWVLARI